MSQKSNNNPPNTTDSLLTCQEAADLLKISKYTVKRWLREKKLSGTKLKGNRWKVFKQSCFDIMENGRNSDE